MEHLFRTFGFILGCMLVVLVFFLACGLSWIMTCGLLYLICLCFGWELSLGVATGVWLVMLLISSLFSKNK